AVGAKQRLPDPSWTYFPKDRFHLEPNGLLPGLHVPDPGGMVAPARTGQQPAVWAECHADGFVAVGRRTPKLLPRTRIPKDDGPVGVCRGQILAVRTERDVVNKAGTAGEGVSHLTVRDIPNQ